MSFRASPAVHVSRLRVVSDTSAATSIRRTTNATRSSIRVIPARGPASLPVFLIQRLARAVVLDLQFLDLRAALPGFRLARVHGVKGALLVLDVEADVELAGVLQIAPSVDLDVGATG